MRLAVAVIATVALGLAGCGGGDKDQAEDKDDTGGPVACSTLVGESVTEESPDCTSTDGVVMFMGYDDCEDGRTLWASDVIHGFVGETWQAGDWQPAWDACYGH